MGISADSQDSPGWLRRAIHPFVPADFHDPIGLARRLLKNPDPAARFAIRAAAAAPLAIPMDVLLTPFERRMYREAGAPTRPIVLVCGSARSGTSLAAQLLIRNLLVAFFDNLASVFPRSPLTARRLLGQRLHRSLIAYRSYYGRTSGWSAPNDALNLWDRWLGRDRSRVPERLDDKTSAEMSAFFGAFERETGLPVVAKNNALNASAHLVSGALPTARFICLQRSRNSLALSLYRARIDMHGAATVPYGLTSGDVRRPDDGMEDICRQVLYHERLAREQQARIGAERFMIVRYEDICREPRSFVETVGRVFLEYDRRISRRPTRRSSPFAIGHRVGDGGIARESIRETFSRLGAECEFPAPDNFQPAGSARA